MEAHEALVAGVLGIATLLAHGRRHDPVDRTFAVVLLWICVTGVVGLLVAGLDDPWRYVRMALRLTGPVVLLVVCEESVRTRDFGGSRRNSHIFGVVLWLLGLGYYIFSVQRGPAQVGFDAIGYPLRVGVTAWMGILLICSLGALMSLVPAMLKRIKPGFAGIAAFALLASEMWAAVDPRWSSGALGPLSFRTLLTLGLAVVAVIKAYSAGFELSMTSAAGEGPQEPEGEADAKGEKKAAEAKPKGGKAAAAEAKPKGGKAAAAEEEEDEDGAEEKGDADEEEDRPSKSGRKRTSGSRSGKKRKKK